jgi:TPR repeat protein
VKRKPVALHQTPGPEVRIQAAPMSPTKVNINPPQMGIAEPEHGRMSYGGEEPRQSMHTHDSGMTMGDSMGSLPIRTKASSGHGRHASEGGQVQNRHLSDINANPREERDGEEAGQVEQDPAQGFHYHAFEDGNKKQTQNGQHRASQMTVQSTTSSSSGGEHLGGGGQNGHAPRTNIPRPASSYVLGQEMRGRTLSPMSAMSDSQQYGRDLSLSRRSPLSRPTSYVDLLNNLPYSQQIAPGGPLNNASLKSVVGNAASLLDTKKTLDMYRANVKKTNDAAVQYEFAIFMINAARDLTPEDGVDPTELTNEAKQILQRLSDRAYPFAQYYLADGFSSGLFNKGKPDLDKSFSLFVAASKHGHAEAGYRAALCYEFGWGTAKSYPKAVQFYRNSASKNHPGAAARLGLACISGDMGLKGAYREGVKWLKRASESADFQYNAGPYELGLMHLTGHGEVIFKDEAYAAQLLTQSAELGHAHANFLMGEAYENGLYGCPRDAALSVHFYNGAATRGHAEAQMALCAWYMVGAEPVLERDEGEAYAWAKQAAESGEFVIRICL